MPPKRKLAKAWRGWRRSHHAIDPPSLSLCARCNQPKMPHRVCGNCGYYAGEPVVDMKKARGEAKRPR